jgi:WD40 repeat protein
VYSLLLAQEGRTLISAAGDQTIRVWDLATEKEKLMLKGHQHNLDLALSPDGKLLASAGEDNTVLLWDVSSLGLVR